VLPFETRIISFSYSQCVLPNKQWLLPSSYLVCECSYANYAFLILLLLLLLLLFSSFLNSSSEVIFVMATISFCPYAVVFGQHNFIWSLHLITHTEDTEDTVYTWHTKSLPFQNLL
jgi:hypothetical protein